jgi:hypothetical protein
MATALATQEYRGVRRRCPPASTVLAAFKQSVFIGMKVVPPTHSFPALGFEGQSYACKRYDRTTALVLQRLCNFVHTS